MVFGFKIQNMRLVCGFFLLYSLCCVLVSSSVNFVGRIEKPFSHYFGAVKVALRMSKFSFFFNLKNLYSKHGLGFSLAGNFLYL